MEFVRHLLNGIAGKSIRPWTPITVGVEPAVVQCRPFNSELLQFGNRTQHLRRSYVELVSPTAPAYVVRAAVTAFYDPSHDVWLGEFARESHDIIFAPLIAGTLKRPHVVRLLHNVRIEPMLLFDDVVDVVVRGSSIRI